MKVKDLFDKKDIDLKGGTDVKDVCDNVYGMLEVAFIFNAHTLTKEGKKHFKDILNLSVIETPTHLIIDTASVKFKNKLDEQNKLALLELLFLGSAGYIDDKLFKKLYKEKRN